MHSMGGLTGCLLSAVCCLLSIVCLLLAAVYLLSDVCDLPSICSVPLVGPTAACSIDGAQHGHTVLHFGLLCSPVLPCALLSSVIIRISRTPWMVG
jgi:hypothetical protein